MTTTIDQLRKMFRTATPVTEAAKVASVASPEPEPEGEADIETSHPFIMLWKAPGQAKALKGWVLRILNESGGLYKAVTYWGPADATSDIIGRHLDHRKTVRRDMTATEAQSFINAQVNARIKKGYTLIGAATTAGLFDLPE